MCPTSVSISHKGLVTEHRRTYASFTVSSSNKEFTEQPKLCSQRTKDTDDDRYSRCHLPNFLVGLHDLFDTSLQSPVSAVK